MNICLVGKKGSSVPVPIFLNLCKWKKYYLENTCNVSKFSKYRFGKSVLYSNFFITKCYSRVSCCCEVVLWCGRCDVEAGVTQSTLPPSLSVLGLASSVLPTRPMGVTGSKYKQTLSEQMSNTTLLMTLDTRDKRESPCVVSGGRHCNPGYHTQYSAVLIAC